MSSDRRFAELAKSTDSPLSAAVARAIADSPAARAALERLPPRRRQPATVLAALHDLALAGRAPALAAAYAAGDETAAVKAAINTLTQHHDLIAESVARHAQPGDHRGRYAVLYPAIAEAARRSGAAAVGLIDVGTPVPFNLNVDRAAITYDNGQILGDPAATLRQSAAVVGHRPLPATTLPPVVARIGVDTDPLDLTDPTNVRWLRAGVAPDQPDRAAQLAAEIAVTAADAPRLLRGNVVELLPEAIAQVPAAALPVLITTWALSRFAARTRLRFLDHLEQAGTGRAIAWVSVEGVGVAPAVPTLGDRPASGHSLIAVAAADRTGLTAETVGRCWSRGRLLSWLAPEAENRRRELE